MANLAKVNNYAEELALLTNEMGFVRSEAIMALSESNGNLEMAINKLLAGNCAPPPYSEINNDKVLNAAEEPTIIRPYDIFPTIAENIDDQSNLPSKYGHEVNSNPPPYTKVCLEMELKDWETKCPANFFKPGFSSGCSLRCSTCFDEIFENEKLSDSSNRAVKDGIRTYHYDCYMKSRGPKCTHCCFPLSKPDLDRGLSGNFLIYDEKKYHVECYEKYAGPRCSLCCNVIVETASKEFTGNWIGEGHKMFHEECFYKKKFTEERVKSS